MRKVTVPSHKLPELDASLIKPRGADGRTFGLYGCLGVILSLAVNGIDLPDNYIRVVHPQSSKRHLVGRVARAMNRLID